MSSGRNLREESLAEKRRQIESNPCFAEQKKSLKCMEVFGKDSDDKCRREIENLKICRTFWYEIEKFRRRHNIQPFIPLVDDRHRMKQTWLKTGSVKRVIDDMKQEYDL